MPSSRTNIASSRATQIKPYLIFLVVSADLFQCVLVLGSKIPEKKQTFLTNQRTSREMAIGGVYAAVSKKIAILQERKSRFQLFQMK